MLLSGRTQVSKQEDEIKYFIGSTIETKHALERQDRHYVYNVVKNIKVTYGKKKKDGKINKRDATPIDGVPFKKAGFAMLHSIYGMHMKKYVFESVIGLLMDIMMETKDGIKSREDLVSLKLKPELHPIDQGTKDTTFLHPAIT
jgi:hypothetical protein